MPTCPTCGRPFDSQRGVRVHHSSVHDERLPNRVCGACESEFYSEHEKKYCSSECRESAVSFEGENNPNYRGGKQSAHCELCGAAFEYWPSEKPGLYCPRCVEEREWRHVRDIRGEKNPRWNGGKVTVECDTCDSEMARHPNQLRSEHVFCSDDCQYEWLSETFTGEGHPNWKGGSTPNYGRGWHRVRRLALERDGHACVVCGVTKAELGRNPDVHHIVPVRAFVETPVATESDAHYLENVVCLCPTCHRKAEFGHIERAELSLTTA